MLLNVVFIFSTALMFSFVFHAGFYEWHPVSDYLFPVILRPVPAVSRIVSVCIIYAEAGSVRVCCSAAKRVARSVDVGASVSFVVLRAVVCHTERPVVL